MDYFAFQKLVANCTFIITDGGGIQEESTFRGVPCLTLRNNTERPSTIEIGTSELINFDTDNVVNRIRDIHEGRYKSGDIPPLWDGHASERIFKILSEL